jgi:hypothetical protein
MPLERELALFESKKAELLQNYAGKFALIHEDEFIGAFDTAENAYESGVAKFGKSPFLVRKISQEPEVYRNQALALGLINARI